LIKVFGSEFDVLLHAEQEEMKKVVHPKIAELVLGVRHGNVRINPGFDGVYGSLIFGNSKESGEEKGKKPKSPQTMLDQF